MIRDIVFKQKGELEQKLQEKYITRQAIVKPAKSSLVQVIIGPWRAGKC